MDNARLAPDTVQPPLIPLHNLARKKSPLSGQNSHLERHSRHHNHHHRCSYGSVQDDARSFVSFIPPRRPASILTGDMNHAADRHPRKLVLCFDGTGKNFQGDEGDSNILKIFRMLDRTAGDQCEQGTTRSPNFQLRTLHQALVADSLSCPDHYYQRKI